MLLRPVTMNNTRPPRFTAAAGTKLAGPSKYGTVIFFPYKQFYLAFPFKLRYLTGSNVSPLSKIPHCCRLFGLYFSPTAMVRALTPTKDMAC